LTLELNEIDDLNKRSGILSSLYLAEIYVANSFSFWIRTRFKNKIPELKMTKGAAFSSGLKIKDIFLIRLPFVKRREASGETEKHV